MSKVQDKMFADLADRTLFELAESFGVEYLKNAMNRNVFPTEKALDDLNHFVESLSAQGDSAKDVVNKLQNVGSAGTVSQVGGRYFGFVNGGVVPAGLAAKNLSIFWDQNAAMQVISPLVSKLELVVEKWLIELLNLPKETVAGFLSGTTMANFCGLSAARYRILNRKGWDVNEKGLFGAPLIRVVTGRQAHSSIVKAISMVGLGKANIEWVDTDDQGRILADQIPELDNNTILILQAGNVNTGSFDDYTAICKRAYEQGAWIHIDGAFGLWAAASKKLRHLTQGYHYAHSWAVDGHKTLNTPYDSGVILCQDEEALVSAMHLSGSYIVIGEERDGMYYTPEMSKRARVIEMWATLKYLGKNGVDEMITNFHLRAKQFEDLLSNTDGFEVLNDVVFNQVIVKCSSDEVTERVMKDVQDQRICWVGGSSWAGKKVIRISVCSWATTEDDVIQSVNSFKKALENVLSKPLN